MVSRTEEATGDDEVPPGFQGNGRSWDGRVKSNRGKGQGAKEQHQAEPQQLASSLNASAAQYQPSSQAPLSGQAPSHQGMSGFAAPFIPAAYAQGQVPTGYPNPEAAAYFQGQMMPIPHSMHPSAAPMQVRKL